SLECLLLELSVGDNMTLGRSSSRYSTLKVDQIDHQFWEVDNGSSQLAYSIPDNQCTLGMIPNSFISDGANRYGARATGAAPGTKSIRNSTCRVGGIPSMSSGKTLRNSQTTGTSSSRFPFDLSSSLVEEY
nr:hypothetical protein [Tanacetum cinerariifolium]